MALAHTLLDTAALAPDVQRALAPGPTRMMAARGLAPLPRPGDLITALYQLALDPDTAIREAAGRSARELPDHLLASALEDPEVDPRVLDYFAQQVAGRPALLQRILLNHATADETMAELAARAGEAEGELIAQDEQRLLRHPAIIGALFNNPRARMSTVHRAVELAVRNQVQVPGIPSWDELVSAMLGKAQSAGKPADEPAGEPAVQDDAGFARVVAEVGAEAGPAASPDQPGGDAEPEAAKDEEAGDKASDRGTNAQTITKLSVPQKIRLATLGNGLARSTLVRDPLPIVALAAIKSPRVTDMEAAKYASNSSLSEDVIQYISKQRQWTRLYGVKLSLVQNPKTALPAAMRLMPHLREKDLNLIARSKNVPTAIAAQARKLILARRKGGGGRG